MPRTARIVVPGVPHHVTQRGNNRQTVFFVDDDRVNYLRILGIQCRKHHVAVLAYCLMGNHVHLIVIPATAAGLARAIGRTHFVYTQYLNRMHDRSGHLWQNRFYSCALDEHHCLLAARYVEWNPIRAKLCRAARRYGWSSAEAHCCGRDALGLLDLTRWKQMVVNVNWEAELSRSIPDADIRRIRQQTQAGRPLAGDSWISKLEAKLGRRLRPLPHGRPRKTPKGARKNPGKK